jgi:hypothetical protein
MSYQDSVFLGKYSWGNPTVVGYHNIVVTMFQTIVENHLPKPDASCCGVVLRKR